MVPVKFLMLEDEIGDQGKHHQRDALLDHLQLHEIERAAIIHKANAVGRHLTAILEEGHKHIAQNEQEDCIYTIHHNDKQFLKRLQRYD